MAKEKAIKKITKKPKAKVPAKIVEEAAVVRPAAVPQIPSKQEIVAAPSAKPRYFYGLGRRKSSIAQVRVYPQGSGKITINQKDWKVYFPYFEFQTILAAPLKLAGQDSLVDVSVLVQGGGKRGQAESIRQGIARALLLLDINFRKSLKKAGFLTRDARVKERKKPGLKRARRAPQWAKR